MIWAESGQPARLSQCSDSEASPLCSSQVDLGFIQPPNGMEFNEDDGTAITLDVLEDWAPFGASSGASNRVPANPPTQLSPNPIGRNGLQADRSTDKFREALDRRRLSSSGSAGGPLIPTSSMAAAQQRVALAVKVDSYDPQQEGRSTAAWVESHAAGAAGSEALSPSAPSAAGASSVMSYGSSMKDEERRRKLRAKMDKVCRRRKLPKNRNASFSGHRPSRGGCAMRNNQPQELLFCCEVLQFTPHDLRAGCWGVGFPELNHRGGILQGTAEAIACKEKKGDRQEVQQSPGTP